MSKELLDALKLRVNRAEKLASEIESLEQRLTLLDAEGLEWGLRSDVYRIGRETLLKAKEAELESLLAPPVVVHVPASKAASYRMGSEGKVTAGATP